MRSLLVLVLLAGSASADVGAGLFAQATRYAGQPNENVGAAVELSIDRARWQYLVELAYAGVSFGPEFVDGLAGTMYRGAVGVRHIARRFDAGDRLDFDLGFEAIVALQALAWQDGERELRPELDVGFSWSFVFDRRISFRTSVRAFFTPSPTSELICRGPCPTRDAITSGYMIVTGLAWGEQEKRREIANERTFWSRLGTRVGFGSVPIDDAPMTTMSISVSIDQPLYGRWRMLGEYEHVWIGPRDFEAHQISGVGSLADSGHRVHAGIRRRLLDKAVFVDGEAGGGAMLVDRSSGAIAVPHAFAGARAGFALETQTLWEYEIVLRGMALPDGAGVLFGIGLVWGQ